MGPAVSNGVDIEHSFYPWSKGVWWGGGLARKLWTAGNMLCYCQVETMVDAKLIASFIAISVVVAAALNYVNRGTTADSVDYTDDWSKRLKFQNTIPL